MKLQEIPSTSITVVAIAIVVMVLAFISLQDERELLKNSTTETATISGCIAKTFDAGKPGVGRENTQYATSAVIQSGHTVSGSFIHPTLKYCEKRLYREVNIRVHSSDEQRSRMVTFFDFWLVPAGFLMAILILVLLAARENSQGKLIPMLINSVFVVALLTVLINYWNDYETAREFELLGIEESTSKE